MTTRSFLSQLEETAFYRKIKYKLNADLIAFFDRQVFRDTNAINVAELACGSGYGSHLISSLQAVRSSIALDINRELFDEDLGSKFAANYVTGDIFNLPFKKDTFDFVWNSSSVEHFDKPSIVVKAMADVVKPGGYVFIGVPYLYGPLCLYYLTPTQRSRQWLGKPFSKEQLKRLTVPCGLVYKRSLRYFFNFFIGVLCQKNAS